VYRLGSLPPGEYTVVVPTTNVARPGSMARMLSELTAVGLANPGVAAVSDGQNVVMAGDAMLDRYFVVDGQTVSTGIPVAPGRERGAPWAYRTTFYPNALTSTQATSMIVRSGEAHAGIDFDLAPVRTVTVSGVVTMPTGAPAVNTNVELMRAVELASGRVASISDIRVATAASDANGRFVFPAVPEGQFVLRAAQGPSSQNVSAPWAKVPVAVGANDVSLVVPLQWALQVSGRVQFERTGGSPPQQVPAVMVVVEAVDPRDGESRTNQIIADGRFVVSGIPGGHYMILNPGRPPGWYLKSVLVAGHEVFGRAIEISSDLSNVILTFTDRPTLLTGRVTDANVGSRPLVVAFPGAGFSLRDVTWNNGSPRFRIGALGKNGEYAIGGLPSGPYFVAAISEEFTDNWIDEVFLANLAGSATPIQLNDGDERSLDLRTLAVRK
jgi:hypothetical protein